MKYLAALLALLFFFAPLTAAYALPKYANAEGVPCSYCHVAAVGGGARNYRGVFYRLNQHSFAGFDDAAEAKKKEVPLGPGADLKPLSLKAVPPPVLKPAAPELPPIAAVDLQTVADFGRWQDPVSRLWFVKIPAGSYRRGTTDAQTEALKKAGLWSPQNADEQPARTVEIGRSFLLGATEVTQADWKRIMAEVQGGKLASPSAFKGEDRPVDSVSFQDAQLFCRTLREAIGNKGFYRLPSEAEWEYAARAGSDGVFPLGTGPSAYHAGNAEKLCVDERHSPQRDGQSGRQTAECVGLVRHDG